MSKNTKDLILNISNQMKLNLADYQELGPRGIIYGMSGSGKSGGLKVITEELIEKKFNVIIWDCAGEYAPLKEIYDNIIILGGKYSKIPISENIIDELLILLYENSINIILDVSELFDSEQEKFATTFFNKLLHSAIKYKYPTYLILEEAHRLIPQMKKTDCLEILNEISKRGRKHGLHFFAATQRPAAINKDFVGQASMYFIGKFTLKNDIDAVKMLLESVDIEKEDVLSLKREFFFISGDKSKKISFRTFRLRDLGNTKLIKTDIVLNEKESTTIDKENIIKELIKKIEEKKKVRQEEQAEIDKISKKLKTLEEDKDKLEEQIKMKNQTIETLSHIKVDTNGLTGSLQVNKVDVKQLAIKLKEKNQVIGDLKSQNIELMDTIKEKTEKLKKMEQTIEELGEQINDFSQIKSNYNQIKLSWEKLSNLLGFSNKNFYDKVKLKQLEQRNKTLQSQLEIMKTKHNNNVTFPELETKKDFLTHPIIQEKLKAILKKGNEHLIKEILGALLSTDKALSYEDLRETIRTTQNLKYKDTGNISEACVLLSNEDIILKRKANNSNKMSVELNINALKKLIQKNIKRKEIEKITQEII
ncbi:MAG: DUF87 domain-containing protein [Candidatus Lokiarchaeota archaeon]|nr:DUF87 domain-containing protein [Candidatus Lokiarchaeota archaeon]